MPTGSNKTYSFKAVGMTSTEVQEQKTLTNRTRYIGIKTPIEYGSADGLFAMHTDALKNIKDNFKNLLLTNHGERLGLYDFGANIRPLVFDLGKEDFDTIAIRRINKAIAKYMPFIEPLTFETINNGLDAYGLADVGIRIIYNVPLLSNDQQGVELILHMGG